MTVSTALTIAIKLVELAQAAAVISAEIAKINELLILAQKEGRPIAPLEWQRLNEELDAARQAAIAAEARTQPD